MNSEIDQENPDVLRNFLVILLKRRWIVLITFGVILSLAIVISFAVQPVYRAKAKILVERELDAEKALLLKMNLRPSYDKYDYVITEMEIIQSYPVAEKAVLALNLHKNDKYLKKSPELSDGQHLRRVVKKVIASLKVSNPKKTNVLEVQIDGKIPELTASICNQIIQAYRNYRAEVATEVNRSQFLEQQIRVAGERLKSLEEKQAQFKQKHNILSPEAQKQILLARLSEYETNLSTVRTQRIGKEAKLKIIRELVSQGNLDIPATETSDSPSREKYLNQLKTDLTNLEIQRQTLLSKYTPEYIEVVTIEKQIAAIKEQIRKEVQEIIHMEETAIRALKAEEESLQKAIQQINEDIQEFARRELEFNQINRGIEGDEQIYSMLLLQREEARISQAKLQKDLNVKMISAALPPSSPVFPRLKLNLVLGFLIGLLGGVTLALFVEYFDPRVLQEQDLAEKGKVQVLGTVREVG